MYKWDFFLSIKRQITTAIKLTMHLLQTYCFYYRTLQHILLILLEHNEGLAILRKCNEVYSSHFSRMVRQYRKTDENRKTYLRTKLITKLYRSWLRFKERTCVNSGYAIQRRRKIINQGSQIFWRLKYTKMYISLSLWINLNRSFKPSHRKKDTGKGKVSLYTSWRNMGECRYSSTYSEHRP
jgi:hypothetical protein